MTASQKRSPPMNCGRFTILWVSLALMGCVSPVDVTPKAEQPSDSRLMWRFPAEGISKLVLRTEQAAQAEIAFDRLSPDVVVTAVPSGGVVGYHSPDPGWKETHPADWGLELTGRRFGPRLVISSKNEIRFIHHHYYLEKIHIRMPSGVDVDLQTRELTGDGGPDLRR